MEQYKHCLLVVLVLALLACNISATTYTVGDSSGWDISTNLDSWSQGKQFVVGDVLVFMYSSYHSVDEVAKQDFKSCNTTNILNTYANGNTTVPLTKPGSRYFICGNKLHCLGGMRLQVNVEGNQAPAPVGAPQAAPSRAIPARTMPSSKTDSPSRGVPTSSGFASGGSGSVVLALVVSIGALLLFV